MKKETIVAGKATGDLTASGNNIHESNGQFGEKDSSDEDIIEAINDEELDSMLKDLDLALSLEEESDKISSYDYYDYQDLDLDYLLNNLGDNEEFNELDKLWDDMNNIPVIGDFKFVSREEYKNLVQMSQITNDEKNIIYSSRRWDWGGYVGTSNSFEINSALRNNNYDVIKQNQDVIDTLDNVISKNKTNKDIRAYRMLDFRYLYNTFRDVFEKNVNIPDVTEINRISSFTNKSLKEVAEELKRYIGTKLPTEKAYSSLSLVKGQNVFARRKVQILMDIPSESNMYVTENKGESEAILGRNSNFVLKDVNMNPAGDGIILLYGYLGGQTNE